MGAGRFGSFFDELDLPKLRPVRPRVLAPGVVPVVKMLELDRQQRCLEGVEALVVAQQFVCRSAQTSEIPELASPVGDVAVVRRDGAAVAERPEILARIKAERTSVAKRTGTGVPGRRPLRLRSILEHQQSVLGSQRLSGSISHACP
jgi:hypothetical protein